MGLEWLKTRIMKKGELESYKQYILNEELKASVGQKKFNNLKKLNKKVKDDGISIGDFLKEIKKGGGKFGDVD